MSAERRKTATRIMGKLNLFMGGGLVVAGFLDDKFPLLICGLIVTFAGLIGDSR